MRRVSYLVGGDTASGVGLIVECDNHAEMQRVIDTWPAEYGHCGRITRRQAESPEWRNDDRIEARELLRAERID